MASPKPSAEVLNIQLTEFTYNADYDFSSVDEVELKATVLNRAPPEKNQFDVVIKLVYYDKKASIPVLTTSCVTNYALKSMPTGSHPEHPESGESAVNIPAYLVHLMKVEAIAHARALVAIQAASTPFGRIYVSLGVTPIMQMLQEAFESADDEETVKAMPEVKATKRKK